MDIFLHVCIYFLKPLFILNYVEERKLIIFNQLLFNTVVKNKMWNPNFISLLLSNIVYKFSRFSEVVESQSPISPEI